MAVGHTYTKALVSVELECMPSLMRLHIIIVEGGFSGWESLVCHGPQPWAHQRQEDSVADGETTPIHPPRSTVRQECVEVKACRSVSAAGQNSYQQCDYPLYRDTSNRGHSGDGGAGGASVSLALATTFQLAWTNHRQQARSHKPNPVGSGQEGEAVAAFCQGHWLGLTLELVLVLRRP